MASDEERLKTLSQRFNSKKASLQEVTTPTRTKPKKEIERSRHSLYLEKTLVERTDQAYKGIAHDLYPTEITKSDFLEACLEYALSHLDEIKESLIGHV
jgi:hypothetical protein